MDISLIAAAKAKAQFAPETAVFVGESKSCTYASLLEEAEALAGGLWQLGIRPGDVISFQLPNWYEAAVINLCASALELICSPLVPIYRGAELRFMLNDSRSRAVFIPGRFGQLAFADMYHSLAIDLLLQPIVITVRDEESEGDSYESLLEMGRLNGHPELAPPSQDVQKLLLYTSGTTGPPKAVRHSQRTLNHAMARSVEKWGLEPGDRMLMPSPVTHATGYLNALEMPFFFGTQSVLMDRWDAFEAARLIDEFRVSATVGATPFLQELTDAAIARGSSLESLRIFACGGAAVPPEIVLRANAVMARKPAFRAYGSSEAPYVTLGYLARDDAVKAAWTDGQLSGYELRLLDERGNDVAPGECGEIAVRGASLFLGYGSDDDTRASFTDDGYFLTGDIGVRDGQDALLITDRKKDIIIRGGENISAREVEDLLMMHADIAEAAVVAMPHARLGEGVCAYVVLARSKSLTVEDVGAFLTKHDLARQKYPERIFEVAALPKTPSGKVRKDVLRGRVAAQVRQLLD
jgi:acyl-CoA synthetase (AMP-forming)/AMP-acid ligase II